MAIMVMRPNQIMLMPKFWITGMTKGSTISMIDSESRKQPSRMTTTR